MTHITKPRKQEVKLTLEQKLDYAKLMLHENHTNKQLWLFYFLTFLLKNNLKNV